jgi:hypothetical protein
VVLTYDHHAWQELKLNGCAVRLERAPPKSEAAHSASQAATRNEPPGRSPADSREREKEREREREKEKARDVERREREKEREKEQKEREKTERARDVERRETEKVREKEQKEREQREREQRERERDRQQRPGAFPVPPGDRREPLQAERERFSVGDAGARPHSANVGSVPFSSDSRGVQGPGPAVDATPKMCGVGMVLEPPDPGPGKCCYVHEVKGGGPLDMQSVRVRPGDILVSVDAFSCVGKSRDEIKRHVLGPAGSTVALVFARPRGQEFRVVCKRGGAPKDIPGQRRLQDLATNKEDLSGIKRSRDEADRHAADKRTRLDSDATPDRKVDRRPDIARDMGVERSAQKDTNRERMQERNEDRKADKGGAQGVRDLRDVLRQPHARDTGMNEPEALRKQGAPDFGMRGDGIKRDVDMHVRHGEREAVPRESARDFGVRNPEALWKSGGRDTMMREADRDRDLGGARDHEMPQRHSAHDLGARDAVAADADRHRKPGMRDPGMREPLRDPGMREPFLDPGMRDTTQRNVREDVRDLVYPGMRDTARDTGMRDTGRDLGVRDLAAKDSLRDLVYPGARDAARDRGTRDSGIRGSSREPGINDFGMRDSPRDWGMRDSGHRDSRRDAPARDFNIRERDAHREPGMRELDTMDQARDLAMRFADVRDSPMQNMWMDPAVRDMTSAGMSRDVGTRDAMRGRDDVRMVGTGAGAGTRDANMMPPQKFREVAGVGRRDVADSSRSIEAGGENEACKIRDIWDVRRPRESRERDVNKDVGDMTSSRSSTGMGDTRSSSSMRDSRDGDRRTSVGSLREASLQSGWSEKAETWGRGGGKQGEGLQGFGGERRVGQDGGMLPPDVNRQSPADSLHGKIPPPPPHPSNAHLSSMNAPGQYTSHTSHSSQQSPGAWSPSTSHGSASQHGAPAPPNGGPLGWRASDMVYDSRVPPPQTSAGVPKSNTPNASLSSVNAPAQRSRSQERTPQFDNSNNMQKKPQDSGVYMQQQQQMGGSTAVQQMGGSTAVQQPYARNEGAVPSASSHPQGYGNANNMASQGFSNSVQLSTPTATFSGIHTPNPQAFGSTHAASAQPYGSSISSNSALQPAQAYSSMQAGVQVQQFNSNNASGPLPSTLVSQSQVYGSNQAGTPQQPVTQVYSSNLVAQAYNAMPTPTSTQSYNTQAYGSAMAMSASVSGSQPSPSTAPQAYASTINTQAPNQQQQYVMSALSYAITGANASTTAPQAYMTPAAQQYGITTGSQAYNNAGLQQQYMTSTAAKADIKTSAGASSSFEVTDAPWRAKDSSTSSTSESSHHPSSSVVLVSTQQQHVGAFSGVPAYTSASTVLASARREVEVGLCLVGPSNILTHAWLDMESVSAALVPYGRVTTAYALPNTHACYVKMAAREDVAAALREGKCIIKGVTVSLFPADHPVSASLVGLKVVCM